MPDNTTLEKVVRNETNLGNLQKLFDQHNEQDEERFERVFGLFQKGFEKIDDRFDKVDDRLDVLWDDKNKKTGAFWLGKSLAGIVGGGIVAIIDALSYGGWHLK